MKGGICTVEDFIKSNVNNFYERVEKMGANKLSAIDKKKYIKIHSENINDFEVGNKYVLMVK